MDSEPDIDLKIEVFSEKTEPEPIDVERNRECPLKKVVPKIKESLNDLK